MCLVLAEDDDDTRETAAQLLRGEGYTVWIAAHGRDVLDYLDAGLSPCFILTDAVMPLLDGVALASTLAARRAGVPIVFWTAHLDKVPPGYTALGKPTSAAMLLQTVAFHSQCRPRRNTG